MPSAGSRAASEKLRKSGRLRIFAMLDVVASSSRNRVDGLRSVSGVLDGLGSLLDPERMKVEERPP